MSTWIVTYRRANLDTHTTEHDTREDARTAARAINDHPPSGDQVSRDPSVIVRARVTRRD